MSGKPGQKGTKATEISKRFRADFLEMLDGRAEVTRTLRERLSALISDLGGLDGLSYQEVSLCKRAVHLERLIELRELKLANGGTVDVNEYLSAINCFAGLLGKLGMKRKARTVTLKDYLSTKPEPDPACPAPSPITKEEG